MNTSSVAPHRPDSLTGAISAFEGVREACALINGPIGCKTYTAYFLDWQDPQATFLDRSFYLTDFHFGQSRVPSTYVDEQDYVYGAKQKILQAVQMLDSRSYKLIGVINASGTSLTGEDLTGILAASKLKAKIAVIDSSGFTGTFAKGFRKAVIEILRAITERSDEKILRSVNIIGPTIFHYNWENDVAELKRMLGLLGITVLSVICAGESLHNLKKAGRAELNLVVYEEYGNTVAKFLEKKFGTPALGMNKLAPFGLTSSEDWFGSIADHFNLPYGHIELESKRVRMNCYRILSRTSTFRSRLKGVTFGIFGDSSQVAPIMAFLHQYLGMYPVIVGLREVGNASHPFIEHYLATHSIDTSFFINPDQYTIRDSLIERKPDVIFGSSIEARISRTLGENYTAFIPVSFPYSEKVVLTYRPLIGFHGVLTFVEDIINSLKHHIHKAS